MKHGRWPPRLLLRVYLYGVLMLALAGGASFLIGRYVITPAVDLPSRPSTAWIAWHLLENVQDRELVERQLLDLKQRSRVEMTLLDRAGRLLASSEHPPAPPLAPADLTKLSGEQTRFASGSGWVALLGSDGSVARYAHVAYPVAKAPLQSAMAQLLAALAVLAVFSIPLARSITAPLHRLGKLARRFGAGDLEARSGLSSDDEIGDLARAFDDMADRVIKLRSRERELLANVSHELRTPLARIRMALDLIREGDRAQAQAHLSDIDEDLAELEALIDDVMTATRLDLSRGSAGDALPPLHRRSLGGRELVEAACQRFARRFPQRRLDCQVAEDAPRVHADPTLLRRVLDNLLDNAEKFSEPDAAIAIECKPSADGAALVVEVRDRGIGIATEDQERVFEPFFRADRSRTRRTGGVGLGLALSRRILEAHGGSIAVESELGRGSCFRIQVPAEPAGAPRAEGRPAAAPPGGEPQGDIETRR